MSETSTETRALTRFARPYPVSEHDHVHLGVHSCADTCGDWYCTRERGHDGQHEAGLSDRGPEGARIAALWSPDDVPSRRLAAPGTLDWATLIDAIHSGASAKSVLPLVADAIEALAADRVPEHVVGFMARAARGAYTDAADLVRGLMEEGQ